MCIPHRTDYNRTFFEKHIADGKSSNYRSHCYYWIGCQYANDHNLHFVLWSYSLKSTDLVEKYRPINTNVSAVVGNGFLRTV